MSNRIAIKVHKAAERMIRKEHPWLFESAIVKQSATGESGDLVIVYEQKNNKLMAIGLYDPDSPIRVKLLHFKKPTTINKHWFEEKIKAAYQKRIPLLATDTNSYRLIHGENDGLPSLIADIYSNVLVIKLYAAIWLPYFDDLVALLLLQTKCDIAVLRLSRNLQKAAPSLTDGQVIRGDLPQEVVIFKEHGLSFAANVIKGHKTGYFLDHRHNRKRVGQLAKGKSVLDIFAYAGGFSVHALAGGANKVVSLDISAQALEMASQNVALNKLSARHEVMAIDAFKGMAQLSAKNSKFDLVIVDPPAFAKNANEIDLALRTYARLVDAAINLINKNGILLMASCSSRVKADVFFEVVLARLKQSGRKFVEMERSFHDIDHPIGFPEGAYLKSIYIAFEDAR